MKKSLTALVLLIGVAIMSLPTSCYYENEQDLYGPDPTNNCDTLNMRYSVEIKQIFVDNCNSCHLPLAASYSGYPFENYDQIKEIADNGKLLDRINSQAAPMPQTGLMDKCNRLKIEAWVHDGAPNN